MYICDNLFLAGTEKVTMIKVYLVFMALGSLCNAEYVYDVNKMSSMNRVRTPSVFRSGVMLHRSMYPTRMAVPASQRTAYGVYNNPPYRYTLKKVTTPQRNVFANQWRTTPQIPSLQPVPPIHSVTAKYDFLRTTSVTPPVAADGAIHTIPAPNLSFSEKPIVVEDASQNFSSKDLQPTYEVTEKFVEPSYFKANPRIVKPIQFSKSSLFPQTQLSVRNSGALQVASTYGLPAIQLSKPFIHQQITLQSLTNGINGLPVQHDLSQRGPEGIIIPTNSLYQTNPTQNLPNQLAQHSPSIEIIPLTADLQNQIHHQQLPEQVNQQEFVTSIQQLQSFIPPNPQAFIEFYQHPFAQKYQQPLLLQNQQPLIQQHQQPLIEFQPSRISQNQPVQAPQQNLLQQHQQPQANEQLLNQPQTQDITEKITLLQNEQENYSQDNLLSEESQKNYILSQPQEHKYVSLKPQAFTLSNATDKNIETTTVPPKNVTPEVTVFVTQPPTVQYVAEKNQVKEKITPIYYPQVEQGVDNSAFKGIVSAIDEVRSAQALDQVNKRQEQVTPKENMTTTLSPVTTFKTETNPAQITERYDREKSMIEFKNLIATPFEKPVESVNVAYTLLRANEKEPKVDKDGSVFAGQLVEASISEDQEFNKEKANLARRTPQTLLPVTEKSTTETPKPTTVVKAKIPPKSKLTYDDRTGEPVLRIYATYLDNPLQKELTTKKLSNLKPAKDTITRRHDTSNSWKTSTAKNLEEDLSMDENQVTEFGLKIKSRSDDYLPLFDYYD